MSRTSFSLSSNLYGFPNFTGLRDRSDPDGRLRLIARGYDQPAAATTFVGSQINENAQGLTIDNLVEYGYSIPHRYRSQGSGQLKVGARDIVA